MPSIGLDRSIAVVDKGVSKDGGKSTPEEGDCRDGHRIAPPLPPWRGAQLLSAAVVT